MTPTRDQLDVATRAFVMQYRKECVRRGVPVENTLPPLEELPPDVVAAIMRCVGAVLIAGDPANVKRVMERAGNE